MSKKAELKLQLHQLIDGISDNSVLQALYTLLSSTSASKQDDWWNTLSEESKAATLESLEQAGKGETLSHKQLMAKLAEKFPHLKF